MSEVGFIMTQHECVHVCMCGHWKLVRETYILFSQLEYMFENSHNFSFKKLHTSGKKGQVDRSGIVRQLRAWAPSLGLRVLLHHSVVVVRPWPSHVALPASGEGGWWGNLWRPGFLGENRANVSRTQVRGWYWHALSHRFPPSALSAAARPHP